MCNIHQCNSCSTSANYSRILHAVIFICSVWLVGSRDASVQPVQSKRQIRVVTIQASPYISLRWEPGLIGNDRYQGNHISIVRAITSELDWNFRLQLAPDGKLGTSTSEETETGTETSWDGMVGELLRNTADLAVGPLTITRDRANVADFTQTISEIKLTLLTSKPDGRTTQSIPLETRIQPLSGFKYGVVRGSETERLLETADDNISKRLWETIKENYNDVSVENTFEGLDKVRREKYGLVLDATTAKFFASQEPCDLTTSGNWATGKHYAFATRKESPLLAEINNVITRMKENEAAWDRIVNGVQETRCGSRQQGGNSRNSRTGQDILTFSPTALPHLRVTTTIMPPFVQPVEQTIHTEKEVLDGYIVELLRHLSENVPFTFDLQKVKDGDGLGRRHRDGTYSGILGELIRNEVDLAAAPFTDNNRYSNYLEYTKPFMHSTLSMLMRSPRQGEDLPFLFLEDLVNQTSAEVGVLKHSPVHSQLQSSSDPMHRHIWNKVKQSKKNRLVSLKRGLRKVRSENYILLLPSTDASYWTSKIPCDLMSLDQFMMVTNYMFALPKGTQLADKISGALLHLQEEGILQMLFHKWWNSEECVGFTDSGYHYHMETNETKPTDLVFVNVRRQTTEMPRVLPSEGRNPTPLPDGDYDAHLSNIPPIIELESATDNPTIHSNKHSDSILLSSLSSTSSSPDISSQTTVQSHTSFHNTTNRRRHNNGRHGNKGGNRRHGRLNGGSSTTPRFHWENNDNPDRVPDYIEGVDSSIVNIASPFPNYVINMTFKPPSDSFTFRPVTYTVPTTLTTKAPSSGKNRNRISKNEDNLQENTYKIVENGCRRQFSCYDVVTLFSIILLYYCM